jgi:hypothetical protein
VFDQSHTDTSTDTTHIQQNIQTFHKTTLETAYQSENKISNKNFNDNIKTSTILTHVVVQDIITYDYTSVYNNCKASSVYFWVSEDGPEE